MEYKPKELLKTLNSEADLIRSFTQLKYLGHPDLRKKCKLIKQLSQKTNKEIKKLNATLIRFRKLTRFEKGIAAPQIGILKRFIIVYKEDASIVLINPKITKKSKSLTIAEELCMSMGVLSAFVVRPKFVTVSYLDEKGDKQKWRADILHSRVLQHEIDHLDGILCIDRAIKNGLRFVYNMEQFRGIKDYKK